MGRIFFTFVLTSAFWIWYYSDYAKVEDGESKQATTEVMPSESSATTPAPTAKKEVAKPAKATPSTTRQVATTAKPTKAIAAATEQTAKTAEQAAETSKPAKEVAATSQQQEQEKVATPKTESTTASPTRLGIANLYGKWQPVEGAEYPLEFTKYGAVIQHHGSFQMRYSYATHGENMDIRYDKASFKLLSENNIVYLEIYNSRDFSGRYKKVSQPKNIEATKLSKEEYPTLIVGKWNPINGQEYPLEFTKFGTAIQMHGSFDMRYDYSLNNDKMVIRYDKDARVVISEDTKYYYLELYNTTDFSGRYRKTK